MTDANVQIVQRSLVAYNGRDFEGMRAITDPDVEVDWSASRGLEVGVYKGIEEVLRFYRTYFEAFEAIEIEPDRFIEAGASVVVPNRARLRGRDGIETTARSTFVFEIESGKIARICLYQETHEALRAVGLGEPAPPTSPPGKQQ
jgi:ketosteroid isomerase-like protein